MVAPIPSNRISQAYDRSAGDEAGSVALQAQLTRCKRQLGDWEACASSKTPEGRKIIENLRARIGTLESKIADSSSGKEVAPAGSAETVQGGGGHTGDGVRGSYQATEPTALGSLLNLFV